MAGCDHEPVKSWREQAAVVSQRSDFRAGVGGLEALARGDSRDGYPRAGGPIKGLWADVESRYRDGRTIGGTNTPQRRTYPDFVSDYRRGCKQLARQFFGAESIAADIHELVQDRIAIGAGRGYVVDVTGDPPFPRREGSTASAVNAHFRGFDGWGSGATANERAWHRERLGTYGRYWSERFIL